MKAIILSAGQGSRLLPLTAERPKCLVKVRGDETLLDRQLHALAACGIEEAVILTGFGAQHIDDHLSDLRERGALGLRVRTLYNPFFDQSDNLVTCGVARPEMDEPFVLANGDTVFEAAVLERLLASPTAPLTLAVSHKDSYDADDMKVSLAGTRLRAVSKTLSLADVDAESIGLMVFRGEGPERFCRALDDAMRKPGAESAWYLSVVDTLAGESRVETASVTGLRWWEIDCVEDLAEVRRELAVSTGEERRSAGVHARRSAAAPTSPRRNGGRALRIGLLNNLRAGRNDAAVSRLLDHVAGQPDVVHVETSSAGVVPEALSELASHDVDLLVVNGGDGTLQHALTEILAEDAFDGRVPVIAALRGGRTNMTALDLGMGRDPVSAMASLLELARSGDLRGRIVERPVLRVEYGPGLNALHGMFFGAGVIHRGIEMVHRAFPKERQGVFGASMVTSALLARMALPGGSQGVLTPDKVGILVDGSAIDRGESAVVMATSLDRLFLRMRPFWGRGPGGVRFTSIAADAPRIARALPGILTGRPAKSVDEANGYVSRNAHRVDLRMDCGFTVDGELVEPVSDRVVSITANDVVRFVRA